MSTSPSSSSARKARSGIVLEAKINLVPLPTAKAVLTIEFDDLLDALAATPLDPAHTALGGRGDGRLHPRSHRAERRARCACAATFIAGDPAAPAVRRVLRRSRRGPAAAARRARAATCARRGFGYRYQSTPSTLPTQARIWSLREAALGPVDGDEDDAKSISFVEDTAVAPEKLRDYIERFLQIVAAPRHDGRRLRARLGRMPARAAGRQPEDRGGRRASSKRSPTTSRISCSNSAARSRASMATAWCAARSSDKMFGADAVRGVSRQSSSTFDPHGHLQSRQDRRCAAADLEPALRRRLPDAGSRHVFRLLGLRRLGRRGRDVQRRRRVPQEARRHDVPVVHGDARRDSTRRADAPTRCGWR